MPEGERGTRLLVTNLFNRVQPLIRFELSHVVTLETEPCACGRKLRRVRAIEGRADDVLVMPGADGREVAVLPTQFAVVTADRDVPEFQVVQAGATLRLRVALRDGARPDEASVRLRTRIGERLAALGVVDARIEVETCCALERPPAGKLQVVRADRRSA